MSERVKESAVVIFYVFRVLSLSFIILRQSFVNDTTKRGL